MKRGHRIALLSTVSIIAIVAVTIAVLVRNANRIIKYQLEEFLGGGFSVKEIRLKWGEVQALDIRLRNPHGTEVLSTDSLVLHADFKGVLRKKYAVSDLSLTNPYILIETDNKGKLVNPILKKKTEAEGKPSPPVFLEDVSVEKGSLDYLDGKITRTPTLTRLRDIRLEFRKLHLPFSEDFSSYTMTAAIPGNSATGALKIDGKTRLKTLDTDCRVNLTSLDITRFKPYFQKRGDVNVTRGLLDLNMNVKISSRKITAPGKAVLRDLQFESGTGKRFFNIPLNPVLGFLKDNNGQIVFDFTVEGDMDNPKFNLRESIVQKLTLGIAARLGLSVTEIGESVIVFGAEGAKQIGRGVKEIGEGIREIFQ
jgi:hypothetical protein